MFPTAGWMSDSLLARFTSSLSSNPNSVKNGSSALRAIPSRMKSSPTARAFSVCPQCPREQPERRVPVLVWFQPIEFLNRFPLCTLTYLVFRDSEVSELCAIGNWILSHPPLRWSTRFSADADKLKGQVIQSAHQVVDSVASYSGNIGTVDEERIELKS